MKKSSLKATHFYIKQLLNDHWNRLIETLPEIIAPIFPEKLCIFDVAFLLLEKARQGLYLYTLIFFHLITIYFITIHSYIFYNYDVASDVGVNFKNVRVLSIESSLFHLFHYTFLQTKHQRKGY